MNFIQLFQKYHSISTDSIKSNTLYKPSQGLIQKPVKKYDMPSDFFSKINVVSVTSNNITTPPWRKIMYINTDLEYNFDEQVSQENALINLDQNKNRGFIKPKILSYILTSIFVVIPITYYLYNSQSLQSNK